MILPPTGAKQPTPLADAARKLIALGLHPIPIPYKAKAPVLKGWPSLRIGRAEVPSYFNGTRQNIGALLGIDGLVDIDLDALETLPIADSFLPPTDFVFGRNSKPSSHRFYQVDTPTHTERLQDPVSHAVIAEVRCLGQGSKVGLQTVVPPSTHPSGERIRFVGTQGKPARVAAADLTAATRQMAATALLARHWPDEKAGRNEAFLALAGTLAHAGAPLELAVKVVHGIYRVLWHAGADLAQAEREVRATYGQYQTGGKVTGFPRLSEFLPETVIRHAFIWLGVKPGVSSDRREFPSTDLGNAERFIAQFGDDLLWVEAWRGWLTWDGRRWIRDDERRVSRLAHETVRSMYGDAGKTAEPDLRKALADHARRSESSQRIEAMISQARAMRAVSPQRFDQDDWLLNVMNGTLDLHTGTLREHRCEDYLTKLAPVVYDPEAKCRRWKQFLQEVFQPHPDLVPFIQKMCGYSLTGDTREECFALLYGTGRNGKGTFLKTIQAVLGDYAGTADFSAFVSARDNGPRDDVANMQGRRFIAAQESREGAAMAESLIKMLTGGDRVRARRLYENSFEFSPTFKLWLATNHRPAIRGTDPAIWSRIKLVPFEVSFEGKEDKTLKQELLTELPGILAWCVRGCLRWLKEGLKFPESVLRATAEYRSESDQVGRFLSECCSVDPKAKTKSSYLYLAYQSWCPANGEEEVTGTAFGRRLTERGMRKSTSSGRGVFYQGVAVRGEE